MTDEFHFAESTPPSSPTGGDEANGRAGAAAKKAVEDAVDDLEQQIRRLRGRQNDSATVLACEYGRLETQWLRLLGEASRVEPRPANVQAHPVLRDADDWRRMAEDLGLDRAQEQGRRFLCECAVDEAVALKDRLAPLIGEPELGKLFAGLMQISALELELGGHLSGANPRSDATAVNRAEEAGEETSPLNRTQQAIEEFADLREQLRTAMIAALAVNPPDEDLKERWRTELADRCDTQLTAIDDLPPDRAAAQLKVVADDARWHVRQVETQSGKARRRLSRKARRLDDEHQERVLQHRLETRFGAKAVAWFERFILVLIFFVIALLSVELAFSLSVRTSFWLTVLDTVVCAIFLTEFFYKLWQVPGRGRWFWRHFLIDFVPSIPFGLLALPRADALRAGRALRLLRLSRLVRYVRLLRPAIRLFRAFGFLCRGLDRLVQRYGRLLNRNVILHPTRAERLQASQQELSLLPRLRRMKTELHGHWKSLLGREQGDAKEMAAIARLDAWEEARAKGLTRCEGQQEIQGSALQDIPVDMLLRRLASLTPQDVEHDLDESLVVRLAGVIRIFSHRPICWLPIIRSLVPRISNRMSDAQLVSAAAVSTAERLKKYYDRLLWSSDLYGTVIPSQVIDRLGTIMVRSAMRPAAKLALFGMLFLLTKLLVNLAQENSFSLLKDILDQFLGPTLMLLGGICLIVLGSGWWLRRIARRATEYYERAAQAQFLPLTEIIRCRHLERSAKLIYDRVLAPEWRLLDPSQPGRASDGTSDAFLERVRQSLLGDVKAGSSPAFPLLERVVLLYRDSLDGAPFTDSDVRTTTQMLGNPAIAQILELSQRVENKDRRRLEALDLSRQKSLLGGPYLWFNFIAKSIAHSVACNLVDYNRHAIPLDELPLAEKEERERYEAWLKAGVEGGDAKPVVKVDARCVTSAFTALHFLDFDPQRDEEVRVRFGEETLRRLERDRSLMIRRIFGSYPWQQLPRDERVLNLYAAYATWLSGGRALLLPFSLAWHMVQAGWSGLLWVRDAVREILHPERDYSGAADADFNTAARKIRRMRGSIVLETMRLRTKIDVEYLGVPLPGEPPDCPVTATGTATLESDLKFIEAEPSVVREMDEQRARAQADVRRLSKLMSEGLLLRVAEGLGLPPTSMSGAEHVRAAMAAYVGDYRGVRRLLSGQAILRDVYHVACLELLPAPFPRPRWLLRRRFRRYWKQHGFGGSPERQAAWQATIYNLQGVAGALKTWAMQGDAALAEGERVLGELLRHPGRITEQLVTLRTVQTLALLDILDYREHVYALGRYQELGDDPGDLLTLETGTP